MSRIIQIAVQMLAQHVILKQNSINILINYKKNITKLLTGFRM
jgi:plasmid maintenance system antidote protein VapI